MYPFVRTNNVDSQTLDKNSWVYDVTGLLQHCVAVLRLCHQLTDQLAAIPLQHASPQLSHMLIRNEYVLLQVDIRVLEARATALATVCWALYLPFSLISQKYRESMGEPLQQMDHHLSALRQAAEIAERASLGKVRYSVEPFFYIAPIECFGVKIVFVVLSFSFIQLELDWSHIDAVAEHVAAKEAASVVTEATPLVDSIECELTGRNTANESDL
uniref:Transmembrane protein 98 n=1 Tax=Angiostrongylus cantonensis TaxID=6313 RepID=A0A0K0CZY4_ANGCA